MSTATEPKPSNTAAEPETSNKKIKLMGPARKEFDTFMEQCVYFADLYWPDWKNYDNPSSYIIPPVFSYKYPDVSDETVQKRKDKLLKCVNGAANAKKDHLLTARTSEIAEHIVYSACQQLIEDKVQAPIFVVHSLDINSSKKPLSLLFPQESFKHCAKEFDFLIIGSRIGVVAIEVKSSDFTREKKGFDAPNKYLPEYYKEGLQQLRSVDALFSTLAACGELEKEHSVPIRKILFTPNLDGDRFEKWKNSIGDDARQVVLRNINDVKQLFTNDMDNKPEHSDKPPLYSKLRNVLETSTAILPTDVSEKYTLLISGLRSMIQIGGNLKLDTLNFSPNEAILSEHQRIVEQKPIEGSKRLTSKYSDLKPIGRTKFRCDPKLFVLSPDQLAALEGPERQFIIGAAGTGKTVLLQAKALQLLRKNEPVVVFSPACYKEQYEKLFDSYEFTNYQCLGWPHEGFKHLYRHFDEDFSLLAQFIEWLEKADFKIDGKPIFVPFIENILNHIREYVKEEATSNELAWLLPSNILIDDTCDPFRFTSGEWATALCSLFTAWSVMEYIGAICKTKTIWTALDLTLGTCFIKPNEISFYETTVKELLSNGLEQGGAVRFRVSVLRQVMRCSESVFRDAFHQSTWISGMEPILAHKIQGLKTETAIFFSRTGADGMNRLCRKVEETLLRLSREGIDMANVAVLFGNEEPHGWHCIPEYCLADASIPIKKNNYYNCFSVSSMEWPVVIYASCVAAREEDVLDNNEYRYTGPSRSLSSIDSHARYRATTRATTRLIEIRMVEIPPQFWESQNP